jgi:hypothetical protein
VSILCIISSFTLVGLGLVAVLHGKFRPGQTYEAATGSQFSLASFLGKLLLSPMATIACRSLQLHHRSLHSYKSELNRIRPFVHLHSVCCNAADAPKALSTPSQDPRKTVLITSEGRSGSTLIGSLFTGKSALLCNQYNVEYMHAFCIYQYRISSLYTLSTGLVATLVHTLLRSSSTAAQEQVASLRLRCGVQLH